MTQTPDAAFDEPVLVMDGPIGPAAGDRAREMVDALVAVAPRQVLFARVKLTVEAGRDDDEEAIAQGTFDLSGDIIRAQTAAPTPVEAIRALQQRLERRMRRVRERWETETRRPPSTPEGEWRHGDLPSTRPSYFPRPRAERELVRRKSFTPEEISVEEALFDLDVLDHRFLLFRDQADGEDSIVFERGDGVGLRRASGGEPDRDLEGVAVELDPSPAPDMSEEDAIRSLDDSGAPFVYFRDTDAGHPAVVYRRYDGHYGLVEPSLG